MQGVEESPSPKYVQYGADQNSQIVSQLQSKRQKRSHMRNQSNMRFSMSLAEKACVPGPGTYNCTYAFSSQIHANKRYSFGSKITMPHTQLSPGPKYNPETRQTMKRSQCSDFGGLQKQRPEPVSKRQPDPTTYFVQPTGKKISNLTASFFR